jgi:hypothetical protein
MIRFLLAAALVVGCPLACHAGEADPRSLATASSAAAYTADVNWSLTPRPVTADASRGWLLPSLYVGLATLNALDAYTTSTAIRSGAGVEANPMMRGVVGHPAALWTIKGGATAATVLLSEQLRKSHHRAAAIATMIVSNGAVAMVTMRNTKIAAIR